MTRYLLGCAFARCTADLFYRRIVPIALIAVSWAIILALSGVRF